MIHAIQALVGQMLVAIMVYVPVQLAIMGIPYWVVGQNVRITQTALLTKVVK